LVVIVGNPLGNDHGDLCPFFLLLAITSDPLGHTTINFFIFLLVNLIKKIPNLNRRRKDH
jgi:hypothetical protein